MNTIFELVHIYLKSNRFPHRKTRRNTLGYFSSLEKAEEFMLHNVKNNREKEDYGFFITEIFLNPCLGVSDTPKHYYSYNANGELNDEQVLGDEKGELLPFYYRPKEKIRFKKGDIVEEVCGDEVVLGIVAWLPTDEEEFERKKIRWQRLREENSLYDIVIQNGTTMDSTDDCYGIFWLGKGDTHSHVMAVDLFPPSRPVPGIFQQRLRKKLAEMEEHYGYKL